MTRRQAGRAPSLGTPRAPQQGRAAVPGNPVGQPAAPLLPPAALATAPPRRPAPCSRCTTLA
jgi:hypothetical protein